MTRDRMLKLLGGLKKPFVEYAADCIAGFDLDVATSEGAGIACCGWGSRDVEGPDTISEEMLDRLKGAARHGEDDEFEDEGEDEMALYRAMVAAGCKPDVDYYHIVTSEDGERFFSTKKQEVFEQWCDSALMIATLEPWNTLSDQDLEAWFARLGLKRASPARPAAKRRTSNRAPRKRSRQRA